MRQIEKAGDFVFRHRDIIPIPFILLAIIALIWYNPVYINKYHNLKYIFYGVGLISIIKGELLRIWANGHAGFVVHSRSKTLRAKALVTSGPYGIIRNPLYAGNFLIGLGFCFLTLAWWLIIIYIVFFTIEYGLIIIAEEKFLEEKFGHQFMEYKKSVPRIIPSLRRLKSIDFGTMHLNYLYPERWTILNIMLMSVSLILLNYIKEWMGR